MGEGRGGSWVGEVIRRNVDGLHRGDGALLGGGDALLHGTHLGGQRRLVSHGGRHPTQKGGHLGTGLREAEDVVDEEQDVLTGALTTAIAEVLGHGKTAQGHTGTGAWRFVHLTEHEGGLALGELRPCPPWTGPSRLPPCSFELLAILDDAGLNHLTKEVVSFPCALSHAGEHRQTVVSLGDVVDELHDEDRLAHTGTAEEANLTALGIGLDQVDAP